MNGYEYGPITMPLTSMSLSIMALITMPLTNKSLGTMLSATIDCYDDCHYTEYHNGINHNATHQDVIQYSAE
jgi:hypothetical protein